METRGGGIGVERDYPLESFFEKIDKLYTDMYLGEGKDNPSITTRMRMVEDTLDRLSKNLNKALWLSVSTLLGLVVELIIKYVK